MEKEKGMVIVILRIDSDDWFAYLEEMPCLHDRGRQAKEAFCRLHGTLEQSCKHPDSPGIQPLYRYIFHYVVATIPV